MTFLITGPWLTLLGFDWRGVGVDGLSSGSDCIRDAVVRLVCIVLVPEVDVLTLLGMVGRELRLTRPRAVSGFESILGTVGDAVPHFFIGDSVSSFFD